MKKFLFAAVIVIAATAAAYGFDVQPYAFMEHKDYTQHGKNIYSGAVEGVGVNVLAATLPIAGKDLGIVAYGRVWTGKLNTRVLSAYTTIDPSLWGWNISFGNYPLDIKHGLDDVSKSVNTSGYAVGLSLPYLIYSDSGLNVIPAIGMRYEREKIAEARGLHKLSDWDWYNQNVCRGHTYCGLTGNALFGSVTDNLSVTAGVRLEKQITKDWQAAVVPSIAIPVSGKSWSPEYGDRSNGIRNRGFSFAIEAGVSYRALSVGVYYSFKKTNIFAQGYSGNDDSPLKDPYHVSSYGVALGYSF